MGYVSLSDLGHSILAAEDALMLEEIKLAAQADDRDRFRKAAAKWARHLKVGGEAEPTDVEVETFFTADYVQEWGRCAWIDANNGRQVKMPPYHLFPQSPPTGVSPYAAEPPDPGTPVPTTGPGSVAPISVPHLGPGTPGKFAEAGLGQILSISAEPFADVPRTPGKIVAMGAGAAVGGLLGGMAGALGGALVSRYTNRRVDLEEPDRIRRDIVGTTVTFGLGLGAVLGALLAGSQMKEEKP